MSMTAPPSRLVEEIGRDPGRRASEDSLGRHGMGKRPVEDRSFLLVQTAVQRRHTPFTDDHRAT